jgi:hypothetical protein
VLYRLLRQFFQRPDIVTAQNDLGWQVLSWWSLAMSVASDGHCFAFAGGLR